MGLLASGPLWAVWLWAAVAHARFGRGLALGYVLGGSGLLYMTVRILDAVAPVAMGY